jgi:hypothetical protein
VRLFEGDMQRFALADRYRAIHIPFRAFLHNLDASSQLACLRACFAHLEAGGALIMNVFHHSLKFMARNHDALAGVWRWQGERPLPEGGRVLLSHATTYDTIRQILSARLRYELYSAGGALERVHLQTLELAYLYPANLEERLTAAGFSEVRIEGGFEGRPLESEEDEMVIFAKRPG